MVTLGDIGYLDDEGLLFLQDRVVDMIISGGVNIYPAEIESVLLACPLVGDAAVIGIPDDEWGEQVLAVVEAAPGIESGEGTEAEFGVRVTWETAVVGPISRDYTVPLVYEEDRWGIVWNSGSTPRG